MAEAEVDLVWQRQRQAEAEVEKPHEYTRNTGQPDYNEMLDTSTLIKDFNASSNISTWLCTSSTCSTSKKKLTAKLTHSCFTYLIVHAFCDMWQLPAYLCIILCILYSLCMPVFIVFSPKTSLQNSFIIDLVQASTTNFPAHPKFETRVLTSIVTVTPIWLCDFGGGGGIKN